MWPSDQLDDGELEVTTLDARPIQPRFGRWTPRLGRRWRMALAVSAIALAIIAPLVSLDSLRALITDALPTPRPAQEVSASLTIVSVATGATDIPPATWASLRARPLRLPSLAPGVACPAASGRVVEPSYGPVIGDGPAYIVGMGTDGVLHATGPMPGDAGSASWGNQFSMFIIAPTYSGPVLARGHQLDGPHALLFNGGLDQIAGFSPATLTLLSQLRIEGGTAFGSPWANWSAYLRMQAPGCYAIQLDGLSFSEIVVFRVIFGQ